MTTFTSLNLSPLDNTAFEYLPVPDMPGNVLFEQSRGAPRGGGVPHVDPDFAWLVGHLASDNPTWRLVGRGTSALVMRDNGSGKKYVCNAINYFEVVLSPQATTPWGWFGTTDRKGTVVYRMDSPRLIATRRHGSYTHTRDARKAGTIIKEAFRPFNADEIANYAAHKMNTAVSTLVNTATRAQFVHLTSLLPRIAAWLVDDFDRVASILPPDISLGDIQKHAALYSWTADLKNMQSRLSSLFSPGDSRYYVVIILGDAYILHHPQKPLSVNSPSTVPDWMRLKLARLKLESENTPVPGVGVRLYDTMVNVNIFFVVED